MLHRALPHIPASLRAQTAAIQAAFSAVVPDGVATVTLRFPSINGHPAQSAVATVHGNVYAVHVSGESSGGRIASPVAIWRSAQGRVIRTVTQPGRAAATKLCRQQPVECLALSVSPSSSGESSASSSSASATATTPATRH